MQTKKTTRFIPVGPDGKPTTDPRQAVAQLEPARGLMWSTATLCGFNRVDHATATKACAALDLGGFTDWRLPTIEEEFGLADRTTLNPAIDTTAFPDTKSAFYWASSVHASAPRDYAWGVNFSSSDSYWIYQNYTGFVRAVRSVPKLDAGGGGG